MKIRFTAAALLTVAVLALTACTTTPSTDNPATTTVIETQPTWDDDMTQTIVDMSWAEQTEADKDSMCGGLALYGTAWGADQMQAGAGGDTTIDWNRAAILVDAKCALR